MLKFFTLKFYGFCIQVNSYHLWLRFKDIIAGQVLRFLFIYIVIFKVYGYDI